MTYEAAFLAWKRLPAAARLDLLQYMREEAENYANGEISADPGDKLRARVNLAAVALLVAVAGEPRPRPMKQPRKKAHR